MDSVKGRCNTGAVAESILLQIVHDKLNGWWFPDVRAVFAECEVPVLF